MTDLLASLPDFPTSLFSHLLPSLDKHRITLSDLLTLDASDVARRAQLPPGEVRKLADAAVRALHEQLGLREEQDAAPGARPSTKSQWHDRAWQTITTLSPTIDLALGGSGIPTRHITEFVGESGAGKTQFLLTLLLAVQLSPTRGGLGASAIYISTESALSTQRLSQLQRAHPRLASLQPDERPSLNRILTMQTPDLETQDHILRYQLPIAIKRHNVRLVVIDSIAANYRAEFDRKGTAKSGGSLANGTLQDSQDRRAGAQAMAARRASLIQLGALLRSMAREHDVAIVVANQVADRFGHDPLQAPADLPNTASPPADPVARTQQQAAVGAVSWSSPHQPVSASAPGRSSPAPQARQRLPPPCPEPMTLDHQQRFFTGWGDVFLPLAHGGSAQLKNPSLGLVWANQLSCRVALVRHPTPAHGVKRYLRVVFCAWAAPSRGRGVEYRIVEGGVTADGDDGGDGEVEAAVEAEAEAALEGRASGKRKREGDT